MKIHVDLFRECLNNLRITKDISYREIERQSGVHNISRIVSGEIKKPTAESWQAVHDAFPHDVPEPVYLDGAKVYRNVIADQINKSNIATGNMEVTNNKFSHDFSEGELYLIRSIRRKDPTGKLLDKLVGIVLAYDD